MARDEQTASPGPLELFEAAREKYTLALARARRGPPELALLSLHGSLEDALRAYAMRLNLAAAREPLPQLLEVLVAVANPQLNPLEAEGIRHMHRLRARVAHGEQLVVAETTIADYHQLVARLLPRFGLTVITPETAPAEHPSPAEPATMTTVRIRRPPPEPEAAPRTSGRPRHETGPRRERTVYPEAQPAPYFPRGTLPSAATRDLPLAREMLRGSQPQRRGDSQIEQAERHAAFWSRGQHWLLPAIIVISILLIGIVISLSLQQMRAMPALPTAGIVVTPDGRSSATSPLGESTAAAEVAPANVITLAEAPLLPTAVATPTSTSGFSVGSTAYVRSGTQGLYLRERPSRAEDSAIRYTLTSGSRVEVIGGPVVAEGFEWWEVRAGGFEGWCAGEFLELR